MGKGRVKRMSYDAKVFNVMVCFTWDVVDERSSKAKAMSSERDNPLLTEIE
jgi:hypothetical protein